MPLWAAVGTLLDKLGTSTLITRLTSDVNQLQNGVNMVLRLFLRSPFIVFGAIIMAFTVDSKAAIVFAIIIPLLSIVVFTIMGVTIPMFKKGLGLYFLFWGMFPTRGSNPGLLHCRQILY